MFSADHPRLSISGWYHAADGVPPASHEQASLQQLQRDAREPTAFVSPFRGLTLQSDDERWADDGECGDGDDDDDDDDDDKPLAPADVDALRSWVNEEYLTAASWSKLRGHFCGVDGGDDEEEDAGGDSAMQLHAFLRADVYEALERLAKDRDEADALGKGRVPSDSAGVVERGWQVIGPPHMQRYARYDPPDEPSARPRADEPLAEWIATSAGGVGRALAEIGARTSSAPFARLLRRLTGVRVIGSSRCVRRFRPGLDYTVAHGGLDASEARLDLTLCVVGSGDDAREDWASGEVGGFETYLIAEEDDDPEVRARRRRRLARHTPRARRDKRDTRRRARARAQVAAVYRAEGDDEQPGQDDLLSVQASPNTLNVVMRDTGTLRFVKYVSAAAPGSRWDIAAECRVHPADRPDEAAADGDDVDSADDPGA